MSTHVDLEKIARWAGHIPITLSTGEVYKPDNGKGIYIEYSNFPDIYDPEHNDAQAFELLRKYIKQQWGSLPINICEIALDNKAICQVVMEVIDERT